MVDDDDDDDSFLVDELLLLSLLDLKYLGVGILFLTLLLGFKTIVFLLGRSSSMCVSLGPLGIRGRFELECDCDFDLSGDDCDDADPLFMTAVSSAMSMSRETSSPTSMSALDPMFALILWSPAGLAFLSPGENDNRPSGPGLDKKGDFRGLDASTLGLSENVPLIVPTLELGLRR